MIHVYQMSCRTCLSIGVPNGAPSSSGGREWIIEPKEKETGCSRESVNPNLGTRGC